MKHFIKQKSTLLVLMLLSLFIFGCYNDKINNNNEEILGVIESGNLEIFDDSENISATKRLVITGNHQFGEFEIPSDGLIYRDEKHGFQIKFGSERSGGKIYDSFVSFNEDNNYSFDDDNEIKNPMRLFAVPSPWRPGTFELIAHIKVYTYEEYKQERLNQMDPECIMCSVEEFDNDIIGKNNKYYFLLARSNRAHSELINMFPSLKCREETDYVLDPSYGMRYTEISCDGLEYIDGERKKTGKDWVEQLLPIESFDFFDVK